MWLFELFVTVADRRRAKELSAYAISAHADDPKAYLSKRAELSTSRRRRSIYRLALSELEGVEKER